MAAEVIRLGRHYLHRQSHHAARETCFVCEGGLAYCVVCGGAEADLPSTCPGELMTELTRILVARGMVDFRGGRWVKTGGAVDRPGAG